MIYDYDDDDDYYHYYVFITTNDDNDNRAVAALAPAAASITSTTATTTVSAAAAVADNDDEDDTLGRNGRCLYSLPAECLLNTQSLEASEQCVNHPQRSHYSTAVIDRIGNHVKFSTLNLQSWETDEEGKGVLQSWETEEE